MRKSSINKKVGFTKAIASPSSIIKPSSGGVLLTIENRPSAWLKSYKFLVETFSAQTDEKKNHIILREKVYKTFAPIDSIIVIKLWNSFKSSMS